MSRGVTPESARLAALVQRYRRVAGFTQEDLADRAGLSVRAVRNLELGHVRRPRIETVRRIVGALQITELETEPARADTAAAEQCPPGVLDREPVTGSVQRFVEVLTAAADGGPVVVIPVVLCCTHARGWVD